jgi:hypothetical protein
MKSCRELAGGRRVQLGEQAAGEQDQDLPDIGEAASVQ